MKYLNMKYLKLIFAFIFMIIIGCGDDSPPPQPKEASVVAGINWINFPSHFNIVVPPIGTTGTPKKVGYKITGQVIGKDGKPLKISGINIVCVAIAPNCNKLLETKGMQNVFVFETGTVSSSVVGPPGAGVFEGKKIIEPDCCYIQTSTITNDDGQFTISFFVEADRFFGGNKVDLDIICRFIKKDGTIIKICAEWKMSVPLLYEVLDDAAGLTTRDMDLRSSLTNSCGSSNLMFTNGLTVMPLCGESIIRTLDGFQTLDELEPIPPARCNCESIDIDSDLDGVYDCADNCPNNTLIWRLNSSCDCYAEDSDGDSVPDCIDVCPQNPAYSLSQPCGCDDPGEDTDNDEVFDCLDVCPGEYDNIDSDLDGIQDCLDGCPNDPFRTNCWDRDMDGDVDNDDVNVWEQCSTSPGIIQSNADCLWADFDKDGDIDQSDFAELQKEL